MRKFIPSLTGGLNDIARPDILQDGQLSESLNYEILGDGYLYKRKDAEEYDTDLTTALSSVFTSVLNISPPFYPPTKPSDMANDFMLLVFGNTTGGYKLHLFYQKSDNSWVKSSGGTDFTQGLYDAGISYSSSSELRFAIGEERIIITDYEGENIAHYITVDQDGNIIAGILGIPAPLNHPDISQLSDWDESLWEENSEKNYISEPGLFQCCYTVVTEDGEESNPSPLSETLDMQFFKLSNGEDARWIKKISISNLSIPHDLSSDIKEKLKYFNLYIRIIRYSEGDIPASLQYSQQFEILDKENESGTTGNNYILTLSPQTGMYPSYENDIASIAKYPAMLGGVTMLGYCKTKLKFPFDFDYYVEIKLNNLDNKTYVDAIVRIRLYDKDSTDPNKIDNLQWNYYIDLDDYLSSGGLNKLRIYDSDLITPLKVVYKGTGSGNYFDVWVKIPQLEASSVHSIYFCFAVSESGVNKSDYQTPEYGAWVSGVYDWSDQVVFDPDKVKSADSLVATLDKNIKPSSIYVLNRADSNNSEADSVSTLSSANSIAKVPFFNQKVDGYSLQNEPPGHIDYDNFNISDIPSTGFIYFRLKYYGSDLPASGIVNFFELLNSTTVRLAFGIDCDSRYWNISSTSGDYNYANITQPGTSAQYYEYFILVSWNDDDNTVSVFVIDMTTNSLSAEEKSSITWTTSFDNLSFVADFGASNKIYLDDYQFVKDQYLDASNNDDKNTVLNIANFMPAMDNMIGHKTYPSESHNNNITFEDTETPDYKEYKNMVKWSDVNKINFPDLNYKRFREPIKGIIPAPSFLKFNYQNTMIIFTRNTINRFILEGDPSGWRGMAEAVIEEKTQYGLSSENTLVKIGEALFWFSEVGIIRWDQNGLIPISKFVLDISEASDDEFIAFYCPLREQYILHSNSTGYSYVFQLLFDNWTKFKDLNIKKAVILSAGKTDDNVNLFLASDNKIYQYPGSSYTSSSSVKIKTGKFFVNKALLKKFKGTWEGTILTNLRNAYYTWIQSSKGTNEYFVLKIGSNIVQNGSFDSSQYWTWGDGWSWDPAIFLASCDGSQTSESDLSQSNILTNDKYYQVAYTVKNYVSGSIKAICGTEEGTSHNSDGSFIEVIRSNGSDFILRASSDFEGDVDEVYIKELNTDIPEPETVYENSSQISRGFIGNLQASEWDYDDNDSLGGKTIYVRISDGTDPDDKASGYIQADFYKAKIIIYTFNNKFNGGQKSKSFNNILPDKFHLLPNENIRCREFQAEIQDADTIKTIQFDVNIIGDRNN